MGVIVGLERIVEEVLNDRELTKKVEAAIRMQAIQDQKDRYIVFTV